MSPAPPQVLNKVDERDLPKHCGADFAVFEQDLESTLAGDPRVVHQTVRGTAAALFPDYDNLKPATWKSILGMVAFFWMLLLIVFAIAMVVVVTSVPESSQPTAAKVTGLIGAVALVAVALWWVTSELRENRQKRERRFRVAYGTFLLPESIVERYPTRCYYYPRECVLEVFDDAVRGGSGVGAASSTIGYRCSIRYRDADGKERTTTIGPGVDAWANTPDGELIQTARRWFEPVDGASR